LADHLADAFEGIRNAGDKTQWLEGRGIRFAVELAIGNEIARRGRVLSNSRSVLKILCDLCRTPLAEPFDDLFLAFVTTGTASIDVRLGTQPLLAGVDVELRHGYGIPEKAVASKDG
jgi:hypothetical protein